MPVDMKLVEWIKTNRLRLSRAEIIQQCTAEGHTEQDVIDSYNEVVKLASQSHTGTADQNISRSSRLVALLLCWFLGGTGAHRFYAGKSGSGVIMLILLIMGVITSFFLIGFVFLVPLYIWVFVDFIMIVAGAFTDREGKKVINWTQSASSNTPALSSVSAPLEMPTGSTSQMVEKKTLDNPQAQPMIKQSASKTWIYVVIGAAAVFLFIVGILAAIAIPNFLAMQNRAKEASVKGGMHTLNLALEDYATGTGGIYPNTLTSQRFRSHLPNDQMPFNPYKGNISIIVAEEKAVRRPVEYASEHTGCTDEATAGEVNYYFYPARRPTEWAMNGCNDKGVIKNADGSTYVVHN